MVQQLIAFLQEKKQVRDSVRAEMLHRLMLASITKAGDITVREFTLKLLSDRHVDCL